MNMYFLTITVKQWNIRKFCMYFLTMPDIKQWNIGHLHMCYVFLSNAWHEPFSADVDAAKSDLPEAEDGEMDELYIEAESTSVTIRTKGSLRRASSVRVSKM